MEGALISSGLRAVKVSVNPPSIATVAEADLAVTVTGIQTTDVLVAVSPSGPSNAGYYVRRAVVSAADTVTVTFRNESTGTVDPAALDMTFVFIPNNGAVAGYPMGYQR
jgi:phosphoribosylaminoimidazole (AIR) synthetase